MIRLYNTKSKKKEPLVPITPGKIGVYACGPTVYNYAHIGNLRTFVFEDILVRALRCKGYQVNYVMNITDVGHLSDDGDEGEDKMVLSSQKLKKTVWEVAEFYTTAFLEDAEALLLTPPNTLCKATEHIKDMIALISRLEKKGYTYEAGGNIYFSIDAFPQYGAMAGLDFEQMEAGARIVVDSKKKNPYDFVLWFTNSKFGDQAMMWDSPWGKGYPGWHVECSAMSMKYLGEHFDIHCGGIDAVPVHHTNEVAQSEAATGKTWVNYWLHGEFLIMPNRKKMSKSSGNFITLRTLRDMGFDPLDYRFFLLGAHYRTQLTFSEDALKGAQQARKRLMQLARQFSTQGVIPAEDKDLSENATALIMGIEEAVHDDLHTPRALALLWQGVKTLKERPQELLTLLERCDTLLGLGLFKLAEQQPEEISQIPAEVQEMVAQRGVARKAKNFAESDRLRDAILAAGYRVKDNPDGTTELEHV